MEPLVAVTVALNLPSAEEMVNIDAVEAIVEDKVTLAGLRVADPLPDGTSAESPTDPENP